MSNRRAATYVELFQRLKHEAKVLGMQFQPKNIISDFETALIPVVRQEVSTHLFCYVILIRLIHVFILVF